MWLITNLKYYNVYLQIIHAYLNVLVKECPEEVFVFPYFLAQVWESNRHEQWLFQMTNFGRYDKFILPIHDKDHWLLMVGDFTMKTISVMDSVPNPERRSRYIEHWR